MAKYRIIKKEVANGKGETEVHYKIQRKFLFWFNKAVTTHYYTHDSLNETPAYGAMLTRRIFLFNTEEQAKKYLKKIENKFKLRYKGNRIRVVFDDNDWSDIYINRSCSRIWSGQGLCYEYSNTLCGIKEMIDKRTKKTKISVCEG